MMKISVTELKQAIDNLPLLKDVKYNRFRIYLPDLVVVSRVHGTPLSFIDDRIIEFEKDELNDCWMIDVK